MPPSVTTTRFPLELADRCVKCGLCLPHCPTYAVDNIEGESPRGRIALMQGLARGRLDADAALVRHLDRCLGCRACERACPAEVPYGELIDAGRALLAQRGVRDAPMQRAFAALLRRPVLLRIAARLGGLPGMRRLAHMIGRLPGRAAGLLPRDARAPRTLQAASRNGPATRVQLFTGCVGAALDGATLDDVRQALEAAGWRVESPRRQRCCGALDQHAGRPERAAQLARRNLQAFAGDAPLVSCASGCAATLMDYERLAGAEGGALARRVVDPSELLADARLDLHPGRYREVVLHVPCTQRNVTGSGDSVRRLLDRLPGVTFRELPAGCCGAAGETFLSQPALADALLEPLLDELRHAPPDALVTSNVGCALHFKAGLARAGLDVAVLHPASLVVAALESDS
ncbi:(Fe-S)-binding protein [Thioalkalivibrio sp. XN279]|uniref:(Fe-S)-binding protein n=1 Tax=Thioalkalivibrio sp. XN279 TaxID=2714953 RepID=UPI00140AAF2F|nr:(Fe-S)-binding protein [Thioalkalivibrio sp. XN279]NHA15152.1 (Fe-S)-binding protein [Thioalkalivibrio sp. XN279]